MPEFAANLSYLFRELPLLERIGAAAENRFRAVEMPFPYDTAATEVIRRLTAARMPLVLMNTPPPNYTGGPRGFAALDGGADRFRRDFKRTLRYAERLHPRHIHIMAGNASGAGAHATFVDNLTWAAAHAPRQSLLIAPMSPHQMPDYFLNDYEQAAGIIAGIRSRNLGLLFNTHHAQAITGDALATFERHAGICRHVQIAGFPEHAEPVGDKIDFQALFSVMDRVGYKGFVGAEYTPADSTAKGLSWMDNIAR